MASNRAPSDPVSISGRTTHVAHAWLHQGIYDELVAKARERRNHPDALAAQIVTAALVLGLTDDLLADAARLLK